MTPERMAALVARWVRFYTRDLPAPVARRRADEIAADLHDHIAHERTAGTGDGRIALGIASRMVRGLAADTSWSRRHRTTPAGVRRSLPRVLGVVALLLSLPAGAMLLTDGGVDWAPFDFLAAAVLLTGAGLVIDRFATRPGDPAYRSAVGLGLVGVLLLVVLAAAAGVVGETGDPIDLMYGGVLAAGVAGAALARLRPEGMARTLLAMAGLQAVVTVTALAAGRHEEPAASLAEILGLNGIFIALFVASAGLFRRAGRRRAAPTA
ncbi:hypothetical protein [Miltoncostaea oceani]|uniref:hypothetical protein n=1 Tax=Miltoncostaea oceani TaxID=2843216 RepID=UPI001C3DE0D7|nr:hypothetical protein [Miltoncostaea oceani]